MNILKCFLSFVFLLLYVEYNLAVDSEVDCKIKREDIQKELVEHQAKIELMESTIKNLQANADALRECASLSGTTEGELERVLIKIHKVKTTITTLKAKNTNQTERTRCVPYGSYIQTIRLPGADPILVPCDSKFAGAGWTVIQRRINGSVNFNRTWIEYKNGFGRFRTEFWLGLEKLHLMTKFQPHELYIQLEDFKNEKRYARYSNFSVGNEAQSYELLSVGEYSGNAGNALDTGDETTAKNMKFSTPDQDNDKWNHFNCAADYASGWWFNECLWCNPNGAYRNTRTNEYNRNSILWVEWHRKPLKFVQMMIRPTKK